MIHSIKIIAKRGSCLFALSALLSGCIKFDTLPEQIDRYTFQRSGGTFFTNPELLTLKEIHLDNGTLVGREVIVEGNIAEVSTNATFLVLTDDSARLLVVLTDLESAGPKLQSEKPVAMRVLGTVESGKKGLPFIKARALNTATKEGTQAAGKA